MTAKGSSYGATGGGGAMPASPAPTNVQVIAPATLAAGYTFDAMYDGVTFPVVVPDGGVIKGQRFIVPFSPQPAAVAVAVPADEESGAATAKGRGRPKGSGYARGNIPTGMWRDGLCDCCRFGPFHPHFLNSWCFKPFLIGQLMTRMKMTWLGKRTHDASAGSLNDSRVEGDRRFKKTFRNIAILTVAYYVCQMLTATPDPDLDDFDPTNQRSWEDLSDAKNDSFQKLSGADKVKYTLNSWIGAAFGIFIFYLMINLRATMRRVYSIPEQSCLWLYRIGACDPNNGVCGSDAEVGLCAAPVGWEDICCALWCQLCIVGQMARHTVDYEERRAVCCNAEGVEDWDEDEAYEGMGAGVGEGSVLVV